MTHPNSAATLEAAERARLDAELHRLRDLIDRITMHLLREPFYLAELAGWRKEAGLDDDK